MCVSLFAKVPCASKLSELRHGDPAKSEGGRVVAQCDSLQCAQGVARGESPCCRCDQRIHRNPTTLVFEPLIPARILTFECLDVSVADDGPHDLD